MRIVIRPKRSVYRTVMYGGDAMYHAVSKMLNVCFSRS